VKYRQVQARSFNLTPRNVREHGSPATGSQRYEHAYIVSHERHLAVPTSEHKTAASALRIRPFPWCLEPPCDGELAEPVKEGIVTIERPVAEVIIRFVRLLTMRNDMVTDMSRVVPSCVEMAANTGQLLDISLDRMPIQRRVRHRSPETGRGRLRDGACSCPKEARA
jgi:hypothetical protein